MVTPQGALVDELRSEAADYEGTAGQYLADLLRRAADALEAEFEAGYQEGLDDERL